MKEGIHPKYEQTTIRCACGNVFTTGSTHQEFDSILGILYTTQTNYRNLHSMRNIPNHTQSHRFHALTTPVLSLPAVQLNMTPVFEVAMSRNTSGIFLAVAMAK